MALPPPRDLSHHFSYVTKNRQASSVKGFYKYYAIPGIHNLAGGLPHVSYFPYDALEGVVAHPHRFQPSIASSQHDNENDGVATSRTPVVSERVTVPKESGIASPLKEIDLLTALQYGTAEGYPPLRWFLREFVRNHLHPNVPYAGGPEVILSCGATDGLSKALETFSNVWNPDRDWIRQREGILCEEYTYMNAIQTAKPRGLNIVSVAIDSQGMLASGKGGLADVLDNWDFRKGRRPHLLYTITIGQNPTGGNLSVERRKEIYAICQKYDIVIIEDDPYWNLQYPSASAMEARSRGIDPVEPTLYSRNYNAGGKSSGFEYLDSLVPSYLSVDTDGRVVRLDTFSKTVAPGARLGWITAQPAVVERITRITESSTQQPSGFVQSLIAALLMGPQAKDESSATKKEYTGWQMEGWVRWLEGLRGGYERRMQSMCSILEEGKYSIRDTSYHPAAAATGTTDSWEVVDKVLMYDFSWPRGGMFVWVKIQLDTHPLFAKFPPEKLSHALWVHLTQKPYLCLVAPGSMFSPTSQSLEASWQYFRLCFAPMPAEDVTDISKRLVEGFRSFWQKTDLDDVDDDAVDTDALQELRIW
ncbi:hypothetical protein MPDQ_002173 [Monascus purpureus]|uniref:Aminotransferase class I/classII large domain-containing protein n=1 Tax=Monascus purpureus TaxID=5098 RepID=A0A507QMY5_MONPU|nr:hypothetical protein MPDQ_002173 [Monascus purpureus]BDD61347.1 hypothetical protein MAP00_006394 [Monascus purpureus]